MKQPSNPFTDNPQASALLNNPAALKQLLSSPDARRLMELLTAQNGDSLKQAARQAGSGDASALSGMLQKLTQTKEGAQLIDRLQQQGK